MQPPYRYWQTFLTPDFEETNCLERWYGPIPWYESAGCVWNHLRVIWRWSHETKQYTLESNTDSGKYSWKGHKDRNRHKNRMKRSGQARRESVKQLDQYNRAELNQPRQNITAPVQSDTSGEKQLWVPYRGNYLPKLTDIPVIPCSSKDGRGSLHGKDGQKADWQEGSLGKKKSNRIWLSVS